MRSGHRALIVGGIGVVALLMACSGAAPQEALESQPSGSSGTTSGGTSGATSGGTSGTSGATSGGTSGTTSGGVDASVDSSATCPPEVEPNDTADTANLLAPTRCGAIEPSTDTDFLTFELMAKTTSMQIKFDGKVVLKVSVAGMSVTLGNGSTPKVPFVKNARYIIQINATEHAASVPWRVDLIEQ